MTHRMWFYNLYYSEASQKIIADITRLMYIIYCEKRVIVSQFVEAETTAIPYQKSAGP
jgi:hypothetical protein